MKLREATSGFLERAGSKIFSGKQSLEACARALELLTTRFSPDIALSEITPAGLRDFLARWYVENTASESNATSAMLCDSLEEFFRWAEAVGAVNDAKEHLQLLAELRLSLPRALEIADLLARRLAERGGAFTFPEFLTSFEEGGRSQYDLDAPGEAGAIEGYFRVTRIEGVMAEAQEIISDELVWPIIFPRDVASRLMTNSIINLELVRKKDGWHIAACGFAYPPGTDV
jgi:hypothetical protein